MRTLCLYINIFNFIMYSTHTYVLHPNTTLNLTESLTVGNKMLISIS
jgi:hypothetical protein